MGYERELALLVRELIIAQRKRRAHPNQENIINLNRIERATNEIVREILNIKELTDTPQDLQI